MLLSFHVQLGATARCERAVTTRFSRFKQLVPIANLRVIGVLDLDPTCAPTVGLVRAVCPLPHDTFQVTVARDAVQITAALRNVIEVEQPCFDLWRNRQKSTLALEQRHGAEIFTVQAEHVEPVEVRPLATEQQFVEVAASVRFETTDLVVEHGIMRAPRVRNFFGELGRVPVPVRALCRTLA